jgi:serine/threonine protein kinase
MGLAYLHSERILHRDIKTTNIFLKKDMEIRIGDFGIAKRLPDNRDYLTDLIGTPCYLSPELLKDQKYNDKNDIWALGCLLYELCKQSKPFHAKKEEDLQRMIVKSRLYYQRATLTLLKA